MTERINEGKWCSQLENEREKRMIGEKKKLSAMLKSPN